MIPANLEEAPPQKAEHSHHYEAAEQPQFFTNNGEDVVGLRLGEVPRSLLGARS